MENLFEGAVAFRRTDFEQHKELFRRISEAQHPHTLFIGCSDSRLVPNIITQTLPGELFIVRNVANLVPPYRQSGDYLGVTSAIEFAVQALHVENIVVCGHSNCGGCEALFKSDEEMAHLPHTKGWLELAAPVRKRVLELLDGEKDPAAREWMTEQLNVVEQLRHLLTYPYIREKYLQGTLNLIGWHYIIETGEIFAFDPGKKEFILIN